MTVYLHWPFAHTDAGGNRVEGERRAAYATEEEALAQAAHDLDRGIDVIAVRDADDADLYDRAAIEVVADDHLPVDLTLTRTEAKEIAEAKPEVADRVNEAIEAVEAESKIDRGDKRG